MSRTSLAASVIALIAGTGRADPPPVEIRHPVPPTARYMCGVDCLYVCLHTVGQKDVTLADLEQWLPGGPHGISFEAITQECRTRGVQTWAIRTDLDTLAKCRNPAILHVQNSHYVVFLGRDGDRYLVFDNSGGVLACTREWFEEQYEWDGAALLIGSPPPALVLRAHALSFGLVSLGLAAIGLTLTLRWRTPSTSSGPVVQAPGPHEHDGSTPCPPEANAVPPGSR